MTLLITGGIVAALVILAAYIRRAAGSVVVAYRIGVTMGRMIGAQQAGKDSAPALEVAAAWLMPWRAARIIREEREHKQLLIRTLAYAVGDGRAELLDRDRRDSSEWYDRPMPVAVLAAILRPARAVRKLRSNEEALAYLLDAMLAQERKHQEAGQQLAA